MRHSDINASDVVVTGIGAVTAAGAGRERTWSRLLTGEHAIGPITAWDGSRYPVDLAGEAREPVRVPVPGRRRGGRLDRCHQLLLAAAHEAVEDARLCHRPAPPERVGVVIGTSLGGLLSAQEYERARVRAGRVVGRHLLRYPMHVCLDLMTRELGFRGPRALFSTACTASTVALGYALEILLTGRADVVLAGGVDPLSEFSFAGFSSMRNVSPTPCAPFSTPVGLTVGEGAAVLVLEPCDRARRRGARGYARLLGYGLTEDAHHPTSPDPSGQQQVRAARMALRMAGLTPEDVGYVNAHGTGTAGNDEVEARAIRMLLGKRADTVPVSSLKGALGHTLGAAGAVEAAVTILAVDRGVLPPTANFVGARARCDLDHVETTARAHRADCALSLNFAFGGNNAAVVVGTTGLRSATHRPRASRRVVVTGMGMVTPLAGGREELLDALRSDRTAIGRVHRFDTGDLGSHVAAVIEDFHPERVSRASTRRVDRIGSLTICASELALRDSGWRVTAHNQELAGLVVGTMLGPASTCERFFAPVAAGDGQRANPALFPNTVVNAGVGLAAAHLRVKGCNLAISNGQGSGLTAICVAHDLIRAGVAELILAGGVDELDRCHLEGWSAAGRIAPHQGGPGAVEICCPYGRRRSGPILGEGAVLLALESLDSARARGAPVLGELVGYHANADRPVRRGWDPSGEGLAECMAAALADAAVGPEHVDFVGGGAMSHPVHDLVEARAIRRTFGDRRVPVAALSSRVGVCAATAPLTACAVLLGMTEEFLPSGAEQDGVDPACDMDIVQGPCRPAAITSALVNASSLGGGNQVIVLRRFDDRSPVGAGAGGIPCLGSL